MLGVGSWRVGKEGRLLRREHPRREKAAVVGHLRRQRAMRVAEAKDAAGRVVHPNGGPRTERRTDAAFQLAQDRSSGGEARQGAGAFEERPELRLLPVPPELRGRREAEQPGDRGDEGEHLRCAGDKAGSAGGDRAAGRDQHREADAAHADRDRLGATPGDAGRPPRQVHKGQGHVQRHGGEVRDEEQDRRRVQRLGQCQKDDDRRDQSAQGHGARPERHRCEIAKQPEHEERERHDEDRDDHGGGDTGWDPEEPEQRPLNDRERECPEEEGDVDRRLRPLTVRVAQDQPEAQHEEDVVDALDELERGHRRRLLPTGWLLQQRADRFTALGR